MARSHRRKDVFAAVLIIGAALIYWMNRRSPVITFDDRDTPTTNGTRQAEPEFTTLPGLNRAE